MRIIQESSNDFCVVQVLQKIYGLYENISET